MTPRRNAPSLRFLLLLTATTWACGSDTPADAAGQSGTSSTTAGTESGTMAEASESSSTGEAPGSSSTGEAPGSSSTGEAQCELPQDEALGASSASITIENTTAEPRFVSPYSGLFCNYAQVEVLLDGEPVLWDHAGTYPRDCTTCDYGCSDGGAQGLIINPGETAEISWNGGYWENTPLSEACGLEACDGAKAGGEGDGILPECDVLRAMDEAEYTVRVNVFDTCPDGVEPEECGCDEGVCEVFFYEPSVGDYTVEAGASFPAGATVVLE